MAAADLTADILRAHIRYEPETGEFFRIKTSGGIEPGPIRSALHHTGYLHIRVAGFGKRAAHRLAWLYMTGEWPRGEIDHINRVRDDNRWRNLRDVDRQCNEHNKLGAQTNSKLGIRGVHAAHGGYIAQITVAKKKIHLGLFAEASDAEAAYLEGKRRLQIGSVV